MSLKNFHTALRYDHPEDGEVTVVRVPAAKIDREMRKAQGSGYRNVRLTTLMSIYIDGEEELLEIQCDLCGGRIGVLPVYRGGVACMDCRFKLHLGSPG